MTINKEVCEVKGIARLFTISKFFRRCAGISLVVSTLGLVATLFSVVAFIAILLLNGALVTVDEKGTLEINTCTFKIHDK